MFCVLLIGVILIGPCLNTFLKDQTYVEPQAAAVVPTNVILEDKKTDENSVLTGVNLTSHETVHVLKGRPRRSSPSKRKKIWKRKCVNKEDCGSNNVSAQPTDSYSEKKQADRHGETTRSSNNLPRHLPKHELRKLWRKIRKCEHKKTTKCKRLLRSAAEETISLNLVNKEHKRKELFNMRYCFDQDSVATYNPEKELCCNGLHERANRSMECCGGEVIDNTQQSCCNDVKHERLETHDCCGMTYYDKHEHTCCQGFLRSTRPDTGCCGSDTYHIRKQICCYNQIIFNVTDRGENSCCTSAAFNNDTSICCGREVYPKIENKDCCGNQLYDVKCYSCDKGTIVPAFNDTAQICCDNKVMDRLYGESTECCDGKLVNGSANSCLIKTTVPDISLEEEQPTDRIEYEGKTNLIGLIVVSALVVVVVIAVSCISLFTCRRRYTRRKSVQRDISVNNACQVLDDPNIDHGFVEQSSSDDSIETDINLLPKPFCEGDSGLFDLNVLDKNTSVPVGNSFTVFFKDSSSQTFPAKGSNCRTIFGKPFDHTYMLGKSSATIQMPHSDVQMTLPQYIVQDSDVEVHCSTFSTLSSMRSKFNLPDDKKIASPVVEYLLTGIGKLKEHALVKMPFCGPISDLTVMKFQSDEGLNSVVESEEVPQRGEENKDLDVYYIVEGWHVLIYTKSFSGFLCTTCPHRPLQLRSFLFGSYKKFIQPLRFEVRISLYIADDLMKFADYRSRMFTNEDAEGRVFKGENQLKLPEVLEESDQLEALFSPMTEHLRHWKHKTYPTSNTPIYAGVQTTQLGQIVTRCTCDFRCHLAERDMPFRLQWYMINQEGIFPCETFQCMAETKFTHLADNTSERTPMIIDELQLRPEDRYPTEDARFASDIRGIKEYVANLDLAKRNILMSSLTARVGCTAVSMDDVFDKMQEKFRPQATLQAIVGSMKETQMFKELDLLVAYNFIPSNLTHTAVQVVYNTMPSARPRRQESIPDVLTVSEAEENTSSVDSRVSYAGGCTHVLSIPTVTLQGRLLSSGEENTRTLNVPTVTEQEISPPREDNDGSVNVPTVQEIQMSAEENNALNRHVRALQEVHMSAEESNTFLNRPSGNVPEIPMAAEGDNARSRSVSTLILQGNHVSHVIENETSSNVPRRLEQESNITSATRDNSVDTVKLHAQGYSCSEADRETRAELSGSLHYSFDTNAAAADGNKQEENFEESHTTEIRGELPADRSVVTSLPEESQK